MKKKKNIWGYYKNIRLVIKMQQNTYLFRNFKSFMNTITTIQPNIERKEILDQIDEIFLDSFENPWDKSNNSQRIIVDFTHDENKIIINGIMSLFESDLKKGCFEIYNVCVQKDMRRKGILRRMLNVLPKEKYYYLSIEYDNKIAYLAYTKYFFVDFVGMGVLTYNNNIMFVLGGSPSIVSKNHDDIRNKIIYIFEQVASNISEYGIKNLYGVEYIVSKYYQDFYNFLQDSSKISEILEKQRKKNVKVEKIMSNKNILFLIMNYVYTMGGCA